jgi:uncharacterized protein YdhG (YjbR/CyaY superfamily)
MKDEIKNYYSSRPKEALPKLKELEGIIGSILKNYEVILDYGVPTFVFEDKKIVAVGSYKEFVSLYPLGRELINKYKNEMKQYTTRASTVQFPLDKPLPKELITKIVKDRLKMA